MKKPTDRQSQALSHLLGNSGVASELIQWLKDDRDYERGNMESSPIHKAPVAMGRCQKGTDLINFLESLLNPRVGGGST